MYFLASFVFIEKPIINELLDVVNDDDIVIGREMRTAVHLRGLLHRGVHVFLFTPDNRLLVQQRSRNTETYPLAFDCSVSEHVKSGESYRQAAVRGLEEELGIRNVELHPLIKFKMVYGPNDIEISALYQGEVDVDDVHFNPEEVEAIAFHRLDELELLMHDGKTVFSGWFVQLINWYTGKPTELNLMRTYSKNHLQFTLGIKKRRNFLQ